MQFQGRMNGLSFAEKGKDDNARTFIELKISAEFEPDMDVNKFVRLFKKQVVIEMGEAQKELWKEGEELKVESKE